MRKTMIAAVLLLAACGDSAKKFEEAFKTSYEKNFVESCVKGAMDKGLPAEKKPLVENFCGCTAKKLVERYSMTELTSMSAGKEQQKMQAAVEECKPH